MSYLHITNIILAITPFKYVYVFNFTKSYSDSTKIYSGFLLPCILFWTAILFKEHNTWQHIKYHVYEKSLITKAFLKKKQTNNNTDKTLQNCKLKKKNIYIFLFNLLVNYKLQGNKKIFKSTLQ